MGLDGFHQEPPTVMGSEKADDVAYLAPQLASPPSPSSISLVSQSTPLTTPDDNMLSYYRNNAPYPIDPALDHNSTCYPLTSLDGVPDLSDTVSPENCLLSQDGPGVSINGYASDSPTSLSVASNPSSRRAVRSKTDSRQLRECLKGAASPGQRLHKRVSPGDKGVVHVPNDGSRAEADNHR
jgi:hypothetical protein